MNALKHWFVYLFLPWVYISWQARLIKDAANQINEASHRINNMNSVKILQDREVAILLMSAIISCDNNVYIPYEVMQFANVMDNLDIITHQDSEGLRLRVDYLNSQE